VKALVNGYSEIEDTRRLLMMSKLRKLIMKRIFYMKECAS